VTPDELRRLADVIESQHCTGLSAEWCPIHGTCRCPERTEAMDSWDCPLHAPGSSHAEAGADNNNEETA
jgi:hypothetical protein